MARNAARSLECSSPRTKSTAIALVSENFRCNLTFLTIPCVFGQYIAWISGKRLPSTAYVGPINDNSGMSGCVAVVRYVVRTCWRSLGENRQNPSDNARRDVFGRPSAGSADRSATMSSFPEVRSFVQKYTNISVKSDHVNS